MILKLEENQSFVEPEVLVKYAKRNQEVSRIITLLHTIQTKVTCKYDGQDKLVEASKIYYVESVDKKTFVYCEKEVYQTDYRLYDLEEILKESGFVRISKSCVLNLHILVSLKTLMNSRLEATLKNGEKVFVTRKYLPVMKEALKKGL